MCLAGLVGGGGSGGGAAAGERVVAGRDRQTDGQE